MPEPLRPPSVGTFGKKNWVWVPTIASATLAPAVAEITGASAIDITRILFASTATPSQATNRVTRERRVGDTKQYEGIGIANVTGGDALYAMNSQGATGSDGVKFYTAIPAGTTGFLVERRGLGRAVNFAAGQFVNVFPVEWGPSFPAEAGTDETLEDAMSAAFAVTNEVAIKVAILA